MARDLRGRADRPAALARQAGLGGGVEPQELAALLDAPLHAGQVAGVAGLVGLADRRLEPLALGARGLLRGARLPVLLARLPGRPVFALQLVDAGQLLGPLGVDVHQRGLEPLLADGLQVVADLLAGQAPLGADVGLGPALQVEACDLRPVLADLVRRTSFPSPAHGEIGPKGIGGSRGSAGPFVGILRSAADRTQLGLPRGFPKQAPPGSPCRPGTWRGGERECAFRVRGS